MAMAVMMSCAANTVQADNRIYVYGSAGDYYIGMLNRVSDNGKWVVGTDDIYRSCSYMLDVAKPEELVVVKGGELYDITDAGVAVGAYYENLGSEAEPVNYCHASLYKDGQWVRLPEPVNLAGQSYARSVSPDGKKIGGMAFCDANDTELGAKYFPCVWTLDEETGDYDIECYKMEMPSNMGFYTNDMTDDGTTLVGTLCANAGSTVPAVVKDGELLCWNKMEMKTWPFQYNGETHYYETAFIDGVQEGAQESYWFSGSFYYVNGDYAFGHRSIASDVDAEKGTGTVTHNRTIYNLKTGEFMDEPSATFFSCGIDSEHAFMTSGNTSYYVNEGSMRKLAKQFSLTGDMEVGAVYGIDSECRVLAGSTIWFNDAIGEYCECPALVVLDESAVDGVQVVRSDVSPTVVYDLSGRRVDNASRPGIYVVGGNKVAVKR